MAPSGSETGAHASTSTDVRGELRIGFVPLLDAAPLIVAFELGYFRDERLSVSLRKQIGWGNVRDKLAYGQLHASHALLGMLPASVLDREQFPNFPEPLTSLMALGTGGDAITLSWQLIGSGVDSPTELARWARSRPTGSPPTLAHVFSCSVHHYLLRQWLVRGGIDPDRGIRLCVLPPSQMPAHVSGGFLDGYCVGEPWNALAVEQGSGKIVAATTDIVPAHPDKVLAVRSRWLGENPDVAASLVKAILRACAYCDDPANFVDLARILARPQYIALSQDVLRRSLSFSTNGRRVRSCDPLTTTFPSTTHVGWLVSEMVRWGHVPANTDVADIAKKCVDVRAYRQAAAALGINTPETDDPPMPLHSGFFSFKQRSARQLPCTLNTTGDRRE